MGAMTRRLLVSSLVVVVVLGSDRTTRRVTLVAPKLGLAHSRPALDAGRTNLPIFRARPGSGRWDSRGGFASETRIAT